MDTVTPQPERAVNARPAPRTIAELAQAGLIIEDEGRTRLGDEFRICASRLHSAIKASILSGERNGNTLLVTSKSFSSLNLAAALAQTAQRPVVLVDADLKPGCLSELMGLKRQPGLFDMVSDTGIRPGELVVATPLPGLSILPIGMPAMQTDLDHRRRPLVEVVDALSAGLPDCTLVIDTGPLLSTSDPSVLAPSVSQIVMVVEAGRTQQPELEAALELIRGNARVMLMLNKVSGRQRSSFGAYSYYGDYYARPNAPPPSNPPAPQG
jgi:Mrp family chromosome partitioning ATPase